MVKVTAQRRSTGVPDPIRATIRSTRLVVFPVPAAASTRKLRSTSSRMRPRWAESGMFPAPAGGRSATKPSPGDQRGRVRDLELRLAPAARLFPVRAEAREILAHEAVGVLVGGVRERAGREE